MSVSRPGRRRVPRRVPRHVSPHGAAPRRSLHGRAVLVLCALAAVVVGLAGSATQASAAGKTEVVRATLDVPALGATNLCNKDLVELHGQETITTATTPTAGGGYRIVSSVRALNLTGSRIAPLPAYGYKGDDVENTYTYDVPAPDPVTTVSLLHWTKLVPQVKAPAMWLVIVFRETITADGTAIPSVDRAYLTCTQPTSHDCHRVS